MRHGEDIRVEDAEFAFEGQDRLLALVVFTTTTVGVREGSYAQVDPIMVDGFTECHLKVFWMYPAHTEHFKL